MDARWLGVVATIMGCVGPGDVPCGDRTCPESSVCYIEPATQSPLCLSPEADSACSAGSGTPDGEPCSGRGFVGICQDHKCLPGCGDGKINRDSERCDDGNFRSRDGCSSSCEVETLAWEQMPDPWSGMFHHAGGYHPGGAPTVDTFNGFFLLVGGQSQSGLRDGTLVARPVLNWQPDSTGPGPSARTGASMAYDAARNKLVLFGGFEGTNYLNETWEWDYTAATNSFGWVKRTPATSPPGRQGGQLAYDKTHQRVVLFGGFDGNFLDDTWEYDGTTWVNRTAATRPGPRTGHAMAYDESRDRVVLYGGSFLLTQRDDVWEYDNGTWTLTAVGPPPGARSDAAMAYDPVRKIVLFGGFTERAGAAVLANDTWQYNGSSWTQVSSPVLTPPPRAGATLVAGPPPGSSSTNPMAFELYLTGGEQTGGKPVLADQWRLSPTGWVEMSPSALPQARQGAPAVYDELNHTIYTFGGISTEIQINMWSYVEAGVWYILDRSTFFQRARAFYAAAYDPSRNTVVMFGGLTDEDPFITNDTFEFQQIPHGGYLWTTATPSARPPARTGGALAWEGSALVLFGGTVGGTRADDTWRYDGTNWTQSPKTGDWPTASSQAAAAYDFAHDRLVLVDRAGATWTYTHPTWTKLVDAGPDAPPARDDGALTFDWQTKRMLLVGGRTSTTELLSDVWELDGATWREVNPNGVSPLPRALFGFTSSPYARETLLIGGTATGGQPGGDIWKLGYRARGTPDEVCDNSMDDDGDQHIDHEDPDCCAKAGPEAEIRSRCLAAP